MTISLDRLRSVLSYDPETGVWTWLINIRRARAGEVAGALRENGYRRIRVDRHAYRSSRLAFFYMTGRWPSDQIDHKNRVRDDDRWDNLREATTSQNMMNIAVHKDSFSGVKGVKKSPSGKWMASVSRDHKVIYLGSFDDIECARRAYQEASSRLHGEFSPFHLEGSSPSPAASSEAPHEG